MIRVLLLTTMLILGGVALMPHAAADCEPSPLHPEYCAGWIEDKVDRALGCLRPPPFCT